MPDSAARVTCPYCGEEVEIFIEPDVHGEMVLDCEVCCNPWRLRIARVADRLTVDVARLDD